LSFVDQTAYSKESFKNPVATKIETRKIRRKEDDKPIFQTPDQFSCFFAVYPFQNLAERRTRPTCILLVASDERPHRHMMRKNWTETYM
jgi:hypothetical protein